MDIFGSMKGVVNNRSPHYQQIHGFPTNQMIRICSFKISGHYVTLEIKVGTIVVDWSEP
jgi:hypothetical protein